LKRIYVGNLPWSATEDDLRNLFSSYGTVHSVSVITDRETGRSRGFAFVEMDDAEAQRAIRETDGKDMDGRPLRVNEARERERRPPSGGRRFA
jgi:RNA recognition motif-containing protein